MNCLYSLTMSTKAVLSQRRTAHCAAASKSRPGARPLSWNSKKSYFFLLGGGGILI